MAKYYNSVWGTIIGKVGNGIGTRVKGRNILRAYRKHISHDKSSELAIKKVLSQKYIPDEVCIRLINYTHLVFSSAVQLYNALKKANIISSVWNPLSKKYITPINLFLKWNLSAFYRSIPNRALLCSDENLPALSQIFISIGYLEPPIILHTHIDNHTLLIHWDTRAYSNGSQDDDVFILIFLFSLPHDFWRSKQARKKTISFYPENMSSFGKRIDGSAKISLPVSFASGKITVFLFCGNGKHFSLSVSKTL